MSVQVRRRREAASFLSSYVGAQGELIVDTTSNRVQVHDGATPGGWPAAAIGDLPGRNALINGSFVVNQRGQVSGTALAVAAYGHDRWKAGASGCTYTFTQAATDTTITITAGSLIQALDTGNVYAASMWLTWQGSATARVWQGSASGAYSAGTTYTDPIDGPKKRLLVTGLTPGTIAAVEFGTGTLGLAQLEAALPNVGPTRFERRHGELVLCQRYFEKSYNQTIAPGTQSYAGCAAGIAFSNAPAAPYAYVVNTAFKVTKRATPTVTLYSIFSGAAGMAYDNTAQKDVQALSFNPGDNAFQWYAQVYASTGSVNLFSHFTAMAEI